MLLIVQIKFPNFPSDFSLMNLCLLSKCKINFGRTACSNISKGSLAANKQILSTKMRRISVLRSAAIPLTESKNFLLTSSLSKRVNNAMKVSCALLRTSLFFSCIIDTMSVATNPSRNCFENLKAMSLMMSSAAIRFRGCSWSCSKLRMIGSSLPVNILVQSPPPQK